MAYVSGVNERKISMNIIEYEVSDIKKYELDIWQSGNCNALAYVKQYDSRLLWDCSGCINILDYIKRTKDDGVTDSFCRLLLFCRKIFESVKLAEDYLICENDISFSKDKLWLDKKQNVVKLLPGHEDGELVFRFCELLKSIDANDLAFRIENKESEGAMSFDDLLRFLSSYELELR